MVFACPNTSKVRAAGEAAPATEPQDAERWGRLNARPSKYDYGGQRKFLATDALDFSYPGIGIEIGHNEKLVAGLFDGVFHSQPVQQSALGLLLAGVDFNQALEPDWVVVISQIRRGYNSTMKFRLLLDYDAQDRRWSAVFPDLPGCASAGDTEEEAVPPISTLKSIIDGSGLAPDDFR